MFTGIVEELGEVIGREPLADAARLVIRGPVVTADAGHGDSIAVNGVCLTVVEVLPGGQFSADVMGETLDQLQIFGELRVGSPVNLEARRGPQQPARWPHRPGPCGRHRRGRGPHAVRALGGGPDRGARRWPATSSRRARSPSTGSLTVSGLGAEPRDWFEVSLIPTTRELTTLGGAPVGTKVNLEVDVIAKYVERLMSRGAPSTSGLTG